MKIRPVVNERMEFMTKYKQMYPMNMRSVFRHHALTILYNYYRLAGRIKPSLKKNRVHFIYFHHIFEDEVSNFRQIIQRLQQHHYFISYSEAVNRVLLGEIDKPYITFSFDDGFKSCLHAARILDEFDAKACFFVCPSVIGETDYTKISKFCLEQLRIDPIEILSWRDLEYLVKNGHEIGSHTLTHTDLAHLPLDQISEEVVRSRDMLAKNVETNHFSWPFGRFTNISSSAVKIVFDSGYESCASGERGCHNTPVHGPKSNLCLRREQLIAKWPIDHCMYFIARSSHLSSMRMNQWPDYLLKNNR